MSAIKITISSECYGYSSLLVLQVGISGRKSKRLAASNKVPWSPPMSAPLLNCVLGVILIDCATGEWWLYDLPDEGVA